MKDGSLMFVTNAGQQYYLKLTGMDLRRLTSFELSAGM